MFSGGRERVHWEQMGYEYILKFSRKFHFQQSLINSARNFLCISIESYFPVPKLVPLLDVLHWNAINIFWVQSTNQRLLLLVTSFRSNSWNLSTRKKLVMLRYDFPWDLKIGFNKIPATKLENWKTITKIFLHIKLQKCFFLLLVCVDKIQSSLRAIPKESIYISHNFLPVKQVRLMPCV